MPRVFTHRIDVRFRDCDLMGHVNNAVYFTYLEQTRFVWLRERFERWDGRGLGLILARTECDFRAPAGHSDVLDVRLTVTAIGRTSFTCDYEMVRPADGRQIATARSVLVVYDYATGRSAPIPDALRSWLAEQAG